MSEESEYMFYAKLWRDARMIANARGRPSKYDGLTMKNYGLYLTEIYSWIFEQWMNTTKI